MRVVLDTNVLVSGVFFPGIPCRVLEAWRDGRAIVVLSAEILEEYRRVGERLATDFSGVSLEPFLKLLLVEAEIVDAPPLPEPVCTDADDDKFLACALAGHCELVVSGDRALLNTSGYRGIEVVTPRAFVETRL